MTGNEISFGHASTADGCRWLRHRMPLAVGDRPWESEHVWAPFVYRRADLYYMFYMGSGGGETFISYATSSDPGVVPSPELPVDKPTPLSLELVARGEGVWLVAYFRWHIDRNRLFFGALDWSSSPATITEIGSEARLREVSREVGLQAWGYAEKINNHVMSKIKQEQKTCLFT